MSAGPHSASVKWRIIQIGIRKVTPGGLQDMMRCMLRVYIGSLEAPCYMMFCMGFYAMWVLRRIEDRMIHVGSDGKYRLLFLER